MFDYLNRTNLKNLWQPPVMLQWHRKHIINTNELTIVLSLTSLEVKTFALSYSISLKVHFGSNYHC